MVEIVACAICGGDAVVDSMLINGVISGAIATPWILKAQIAATIRRIRSRGTDATIGDACPLPLADPDQLPPGGREGDSSDA